MARGDGSITKRGTGVWLVQVSFGRDPVTGKLKRSSRTVRGTKADARKVRDKLRAECESGLKADGGKTTFRELCEFYMASLRESGKVKGSTLKSYASHIRFMCEFVGDVPLDKLDVMAVEGLFRAMREKRASQGRRFGGTTQHSYFVTLKAVLSKAVSYDLILRNPCDRMDAPKKDKSERRSLSEADTARLLARLEECEREAAGEAERIARERAERRSGASCLKVAGLSEQSRLRLVMLLLATGARLGEGLALEWRDVDFIRGTVDIREAKTDAGRRTIALDSRAIAGLREWRGRQMDYLLELSGDLSSRFVFCSNTGTALDKNNVEHWWAIWREENGFAGLKLHELRHTQATQLLAHGVDVKTVQSRLGHSSASVTLDFYSHAVPENDKKAAELFGAIATGGGKTARIIELKTA